MGALVRSALSWHDVAAARQFEFAPARLAGRPIAAIAFACGFGDLSGFNRAFKDAYGTSPRKLRTASP